MMPAVKNYDIICLQMRNYLPRLETPLKKEMNQLLAQFRSALASGKSIKPGLDNLLPHIFNFRIKAIKWLMEDEEFDISGSIDEVYLKFEELKNNPALDILAENILFALRCNRRVVQAMFGAGSLAKES